jgi:hypothetical protein
MEKESEKPMGPYLKPTFTIEADHEKIMEKAGEVIRGCSSEKEKAVALFYFVRDAVRYNVYMVSVFIEDFKASQVLEWGKGYCVQKAVLLAALGRAVGIPSRLAFAKIKNHKLPPQVFEWAGTNVFPRHGYNQFFLEGRWVSLVAAFDRDLCEKNGLPTVEFDGIRDAVLPEQDQSGKPYIEYLEKFPPTDDLPFDWIAERLIRIVGPDKRAWQEKQSV